MSGKFHPATLRQHLTLILGELERNGTVFGIPRELFFNPASHKHLNTSIFGHTIDNPLGVAAGPHTQMAQNITGAWLMGARYIELKTIQTLDDLEVPKPCIDMQDEGYNCEWSQELKISESFNEYLNAWIIIHLLSHRLGWGSKPATVFNMSIGYNLEGIMKPNVQWFLDKMLDCSEEIKWKKEEISDLFPGINEIDIPSRVSDNITLSTMHGCPANEIEDIARYLIEERKLHTFIKLNPTLLGSEMLYDILNHRLRFQTSVPDIAFDHDLKYPDALKIITSLREGASLNNLHFGLKLTNTLESVNNKEIFGSEVKMMYMSGRALHPVAVNLARKLSEAFDGRLTISFSAGADAFNIPDLLACGFVTVTVCSDILKPGGYMRFNQYFEELDNALLSANANDLEEFIIQKSGHPDITAASADNLIRYSETVLSSERYRREHIKTPDIKTPRKLGSFDCISAPCRDTCATGQDIPDYLFFTAAGAFDKAFEVILRTNPFPSVTGMVCDHLCQGKCTRVNYDDPLMIREVKRFISTQPEVRLRPRELNGLRTAVIGAGPSGLSCAYYLRLAGYDVDVFESRSQAGGMVRFAIPGFRLTDDAVNRDIKRITELGVNIYYDSTITRENYNTLAEKYDYVFIGTGAQQSVPLEIEGADAEGVTEPLSFLFKAKAGTKTGLGNNVVIIGGGNTAMDAARTAYRLVNDEGSVTVVYRRTINEMPADQGEIKAVIEEGINIIELAAPERIISKNGRVTALICSRMELKGKDKKGRPAPVKIEGTEFEIPCDTIVPAIGQITDITFIPGQLTEAGSLSCTTKDKKVFIGGDAMRGASTAINAIGDGRRAASEIMMSAGIEFLIEKPRGRKALAYKEHIIKRAGRHFALPPGEVPPGDRKNFRLVSEAADKKSIMRESSRCLACDEVCSICTTVCPNFANRAYSVMPHVIKLKKAVRADNDNIEILKDQTFEIKQEYQILNIADFCNECGNCGTFCPTAGAPFRDKPRLFLSVSSFNQAKEGYYLARLRDRTNLILKENDHITTLSDSEHNFIYENDYVSATFTKDTFDLTSAVFKTPCLREAHFRKAAEMKVIMAGACDLLSL